MVSGCVQTQGWKCADKVDTNYHKQPFKSFLMTLNAIQEMVYSCVCVSCARPTTFCVLYNWINSKPWWP